MQVRDEEDSNARGNSRQSSKNSSNKRSGESGLFSLGIIDNGKLIVEDTVNNLKNMVNKSGIVIHTKENYPNLDTILRDFSPLVNEKKIEILTKEPNLDLPRIILKLSENNIRIEDVQLPKASLEDVFIDLTGRKIND